MELVSYFNKIDFSSIYKTYLVVPLILLMLLFIGIYSIHNQQSFKVNHALKSLAITMIGIVSGLFITSFVSKFDQQLDTMLGLLLLLIALSGIFLVNILLMFRKSYESLLRRTIPIVQTFLVLLLSIMTIHSELYLSEVIFTFAALFLIEIVLSTESLLKSNENQFYLKSDEPINNSVYLFQSRRNQLDRIKQYIKEEGVSFNSIAITGTWGSGKTSFLKSLIHDLDNFPTVYIDPNISSNLISMLKSLSSQIETQLIKRKIYTGRGSSFKHYFSYINFLLKNSSLNWVTELSKLFTPVEDSDLMSIRSQLENDISKLSDNNSKLLIVVDDLDRCQTDSILEILKFFNTVFSLRGCTLLFLVDMSVLKEENSYSLYFDKFFHQVFKLTNVKSKEVVNYYLDREVFFSFEFVNDLELTIKKQCVDLIEKGGIVPQSYLEILQDKIENVQEKIDKIRDDKEDKVVLKNYLNKLLNWSSRVEKIIDNPRCTKGYLRELESRIYEIDNHWFKDKTRMKSDYNSYEWVKVAATISFMKVFMSSLYDELVKTSQIQNASESFDYLNILLGEKPKDKGILTSIANLILNSIFSPDDYDYPEKQRIENMIDVGKIEVEFILKAFESSIWRKEIRFKTLEAIKSTMADCNDVLIKKSIVNDMLDKFLKITRSSRDFTLDYIIEFNKFVQDSLTLNQETRRSLNVFYNEVARNFIFGTSNEFRFLIEAFRLDPNNKYNPDKLDFTMNKNDLKEYIIGIFKPSGRLNSIDLSNTLEEIFISAVDSIRSPRIVDMDTSIERVSKKLLNKLKIIDHFFACSELLKEINSYEDINDNFPDGIDNLNVKIDRIREEFNKDIELSSDINTNSNSVVWLNKLCTNLENNNISLSDEDLNSLLRLYSDIGKVIVLDEHNIWWDFLLLRIKRRKNVQLES